MAMKLGSKYQFNDVMDRHWDQFADAAGLSRAQTRKRVLSLAKTLPTVAKQLQATPAFAKRPLVDKMVALLEQRCALTVKRLAGE